MWRCQNTPSKRQAQTERVKPLITLRDDASNRLKWEKVLTAPHPFSPTERRTGGRQVGQPRWLTVEPARNYRLRQIYGPWSGEGVAEGVKEWKSIGTESELRKVSSGFCSPPPRGGFGKDS